VSKPFLKELNQPIIRRYIWAVAAFYFILIGASNNSELRLVLASPAELEKAWRLIVPIISAGLYLLLIRLVPTELKEILVFWRLKDRLPGHRAFTVFAKKEARISTKKLKRIHGSLPRSGEKQNELWYSIYRKHREADEVRDAHKNYLLYRELTYINLAIGLLLLMPSVLLSLLDFEIGLILIGVTALVSFALALNAQNSAKRMVQNVLALESSSIE
jgi:hypothetical protein